jgi:uncharacterized protein (TIGR02246 family)
MSMRLAAIVFIALALGACKAPAPAATDDSRHQADLAAVRAFVDNVGTTFNSGNLDAFMQVFTEDAIQFNQGFADVVGKVAIRKQYEDALAANDLKVVFHTQEVSVSGELAYEGGTYDIIIRPKSDPKAVPVTVTNRHVHVLKRQADGSWKTWRMMTNNTLPAAAPKQD